MRPYLDICCLKRPFDDQAQPRIRIETESLLGLLAADAAQVSFVRSVAHDLENDQNPLTWRAQRVRAWLADRPLREYEAGGGNYVHERDAILPAWDADTLVARALKNG